MITLFAHLCHASVIVQSYPLSGCSRYFLRKITKKNLKILSFNDKDKIKGKVNNTMFDFLV